MRPPIEPWNGFKDAQPAVLDGEALRARRGRSAGLRSDEQQIWECPGALRQTTGVFAYGGGADSQS